MSLGKYKGTWRYHERYPQRRRYRAKKRRRMQPGAPAKELKFMDSTLADRALTLAWAEVDPAAADGLCLPKVGTGESDRIGRTYYIHKIDINGRFTVVSAEGQVAPIPHMRAKVVLVLDTQTNGDQLTATEVYHAAGSTIDLDAFRDLQHTHRFQTLGQYTKVITFDDQTNQGAANQFANGTQICPWQLHATFNPPIKVICDGGADPEVIASISDFSLHLIGLSSDILVLVGYEARIRFTG